MRSRSKHEIKIDTSLNFHLLSRWCGSSGSQTRDFCVGCFRLKLAYLRTVVCQKTNEENNSEVAKLTTKNTTLTRHAIHDLVGKVTYAERVQQKIKSVFCMTAARYFEKLLFFVTKRFGTPFGWHPQVVCLIQLGVQFVWDSILDLRGLSFLKIYSFWKTVDAQ